MTRKLLVRQGGGSAVEVDFANDFAPRKGAPFMDINTPIIQMAQRFANGESAQGYFKLVDPEAQLSSTGFRMRPWAEVRLTDDASGDELTLGWMRITASDAGRLTAYIAGDEIEHNPQLMDCNLDLRGIPFRNNWERDAETDQARLQAVRAAKLDGAGSTGTIFRETTDITVSSVASNHLCDFSADTDLDAKDYPAGTEVSEVIADIAEQSGKMWGVVLHHTAGSTHKCLLYIDQDDFTTYTTDVRISDDPADWDPDDATAPTFEPHWVRGAGREANNEQVVSGLLSIYDGTNDDPSVVFVETGESPDEWETWVSTFNDDEATSATAATRRATWQLNDRKRPWVSHRPSILVSAAQAHLVEAGMAIETKSVVLNSGPDKASWVWRRVAEKVIEPSGDGRYWLHLSLERPRTTHGANGGGGQPASTTPKPAPECIEQEPDSETILSDSRDGDWGTTVTTGSCWGGDDHRDIGGSGQLGPGGGQAVTAGDLIRATINVRDETGDDSWENVDNYNYHAALQFTGTGMPLLSYTIINERFHNAGCIDETRTTTQEVPTGYTSARVKMYSKLGRWRFNGWISEVTIGDPVENDPDCLPAGVGGDSTHWARSDDTRFDADDQHLTTKLQQRVINTSGGALNDGQIVIPDTTQDEPSVTTTTTASLTDCKVGVVTTAGGDGEAIAVMWEGAMLRSLNIDGTPVPGDYLYTSTTAGAADAAGTRDTGAVGRVIATDADDNTTWVLWWGVPDDSGSGGAHTEFVFNTDGGKEVVNTVAAAGSTETLDLADGNVHDVTLTADCTLTLAGATNGVACSMTLLLRQGSGAPWDVTWPGSVEWVGGSAPTLETAVDAWNLVELITLDGGTTWFADGGAGTGSGHTEDHASRHSDGGADAVDVTDLDGYPGGTSTYLRADGTFANPGGGSGGSGIGEGRPYAASAATLYVLPGQMMTTVTSSTLATGNRYYTAIIVREAVTLVALMAECTLGAAAGREYRGGLYEAGWDWQPGALVVEGVFNLATAGVKTIASGATLAPGRYLTCYESGHATPTMRVWQGAAMWASTGSGNVLNSQFIATGTTYGALPDPGTAWTAPSLSNVGSQNRILLQLDP